MTAARENTRDVAARIVAALLDGPVTEYGLAEKAGLTGGDRYNRAREWLEAFGKHGVVDMVGERPNPNGASKGAHPVYQLRMPT